MKLIHVKDFPYNSAVSEQYSLVSDGKQLASIVFIVRDSAIGDDAIEVKLGDDEPFEVDSVEDALTLMDERFGGIAGALDMTFQEARAAQLIG